MTEIADFAAVLLFVTGAVALAVVSTTLTGRVPVPAPAIFLVAAALVSDLWPRVYEHVPILTVERVGVVVDGGGSGRRLSQCCGPCPCE